MPITMLKKLFIAALFLFAALIAYLLWPLKTDDFAINWDRKAIAVKKDFLASIKPAEKTDSLPNIVLILVDDLGWYDMSFYGGDKVQTPHMDGLAESGIAFDRAYVASPMCSASRAALLTGRYPQRFGFEFQMHDRYLRNRLEYYGFRFFMASDLWQAHPMEKVPREKDIKKQGLPPSEITIAELLKARGYATALIGKWHTGSDTSNLPDQFGFDEQFGFFDAHTLYAPEGTPGITDQKIRKDFTDQYNWKLGRKGTHGIFRNYERIDEKEHLTDAITRESIDFIRRNKVRPFFLFAAYNAPHAPLQAPDRYVEMFRDEPDPVKRVYYAMIRQLDDDIGRLMDALKAQGVLDNTLVIFLSDNGGAAYTYATDNGPLRGGKITDFEGGVRVPFFMTWEGKIDHGGRFAAPVVEMDVYSTIVAATGCKLPSDRPIDGQDLMKFITNDNIEPHHDLYWQRGSSKAIRSGDWKMVWNEEFQDTLLYNITSDPDETTDLYSSERARAGELIKLHQQWSDHLARPLWPAVVYFREKVDDRWVYFDN